MKKTKPVNRLAPGQTLLSPDNDNHVSKATPLQTKMKELACSALRGSRHRTRPGALFLLKFARKCIVFDAFAIPESLALGVIYAPELHREIVSFGRIITL